MSKINEFVNSKFGMKLARPLLNWGWSIIILGGIYIFNHWAFGNVILSVGGGMLFFYYFFSLFDNINEKPDWTLVYPELNINDIEIFDTKDQELPFDSYTQQFDDLKHELELLKDKSKK